MSKGADSLMPVVILDRPQLADNIGAVARVMANFGLEHLRLVAPRDGWPQDRAWATASGADWVLEGVQVFDTVADAIHDLNAVYATTARPRELRTPVHTPREAVSMMREAEARGERAGLLFGAERAGLETADIALCQGIITIPVDPRHWSLNLAQAVAISAYEWRVSRHEAPAAAFASDEPAASGGEMLGLFEHLERELHAGGFFWPPEKTPNMVLNLRAMLAKARLTSQEVATFRGVIHALAKGRGRVLAKLAERDRAGGAGPQD